MAFLIEEKRSTSPISSAHVSAVIGPTDGMVISRSTRSFSKESRSSDLTRALSCSLQSHDRLAAYPQQGTQPLINIGVRCQQLAEVAGLVQPLLVVAHSGFHQQHRNLVLHLHHLPNQEVAARDRRSNRYCNRWLAFGFLVGRSTGWLSGVRNRKVLVNELPGQLKCCFI